MLKKILKWVGIILGGLIGVLALALVALYLVGTSKLEKKYQVAVEAVSVPTGEQAVQRGKHLATILICTRCHSDNMGGEVYFEIPGMLSIPTPNLTRGAGGVGVAYGDDDFVRAVRYGVGQDGRALFLMPSKGFHYLSDEDMGALIAYLKGLPPVDNRLPERRIELIGRLMMGTGMIPPFAADLITPGRASPPAQGETAEYGEYLSHTCTECHGASLSGAPFGPPGQEVLSPNLTAGGELAAWSEEDFITTLRTGVTPSRRKLIDEMPWKYYGEMTDTELRALWLYLKSLPALEHGK